MDREFDLLDAPERLRPIDLLLCVILAAIVLVARITERGALYFVDGPRIVNAIQAGTYTIQSPGYWAFAHLGGLFADPAAGLQFWNILFSTLGIPVFFLLCRLRRSNRVLCFATALAFGFTYFLWFAGEIHSAYASQILFAPLAVLCALQFRNKGQTHWLILWSLSAAVGFALRPSDGVFLMPLWLWLLPRTGRWPRAWLIFAGIQAVCFLCWDIPTQHALHAVHLSGSGALILLSFRTSSPLLGLNARRLANVARVIIPTTLAFFPLLPAIASRRRPEDTRLAIIWLLPGLLFFLLCYIADPTYMIFLCPAWFWLAITSENQRRTLVCVLICFAFNATLFLAASPIRSDSTPARLVNFYVVKYCRYGVQHRWSSTLGDGAQLPPP